VIRTMVQLQDDALQFALFRFKGKCHLVTIQQKEAGAATMRQLTWCGRPNAAKERITRRDYPRNDLCARCLERLQSRCQEGRQYRFYEKMTCDWCHEVISECSQLLHKDGTRAYELCQPCYDEHPQRAAYRVLLCRALDLYRELTGEDCICYRYDPRDPGVCFLCFHTPLAGEGEKVAAIWQTWVEEAIRFLSEIELLSREEYERVEAIKQEARALDQRFPPAVSQQRQ